VTKDKEILKRFGKIVRKIRLEKGITSQMSLAHKSGLDRTYIGGVERGERNVSLVNIEKIADALETPISEMFNF
jgi:transcriptional regulator with XRE-family HTH domain